jgi:NAD(P)H-hydrate epimerase
MDRSAWVDSPISLSRDAVRAIDAQAIARGIPGPVLMENAARGTVELLTALGITGPVGVVCGKGNNAGDGFAIARLLSVRCVPVHLEMLFDPSHLSGDAAIAFAPLADSAVPRFGFDRDTLSRLRCCEWVVDALLGTGTRGPIGPPFDAAIETINRAKRRVLAVDLPSGLDCDTGLPLGPTVCAAHTATFVARKLGFDNPASLAFTGKVHVIDIGVPWPDVS